MFATWSLTVKFQKRRGDEMVKSLYNNGYGFRMTKQIENKDYLRSRNVNAALKDEILLKFYKNYPYGHIVMKYASGNYSILRRSLHIWGFADKAGKIKEDKVKEYVERYILFKELKGYDKK
jgi:hypothetical protein